MNTRTPPQSLGMKSLVDFDLSRAHGSPQADCYFPQGIEGIAPERVLPFEGSLSLGPGLAAIK